MTYEEINKIKDEKTNPFYWTIRWKDGKTEFMKEIKPRVPRIVYNMNYAQFMISQITRMIPIWIKKNKGVRLYVIKIRMIGNINKENYLIYKHKNTYISSYRTIEEGEPCCIPDRIYNLSKIIL